ncbi:MAG: alpha/beta fold hydrolase [Bacteroidota bacterium]
MEAKKINIQLSDGASTEVSLFEHTQPRALILLFTAMGVEARYYKPFATELSKAGYQVVTVDYRGNGGSSIRPNRKTDYGYETIVTIDYAEAIKYMHQQFPNLPILYLGHSLGGQLSGLYAAREPGKVVGLIQVACSSVFYKNYPGQERGAWFATRFFDKIARLRGFFPGKVVGFGGKESMTVMRDWCIQGKTGRYELANSSFDYESALSKLNIPLLAIGVANDHLAPTPAREHLHAKFHPDSPQTHIEWSEKTTGRSDLNHFNWARKPDGLIPFFTEWIDQQIAG